VSASRVLVVDDEPQLLRTLEIALRGAGYAVETAASAGEAITAAGAHPPDAVVLDLMLPDGDGTDVCRELRSWSSVPILVLSAVGDEQTKVTALDAGADDYVTKPFGINELLARLRVMMRRSTASSETVIRVGDLTVDLDLKAVFVGKRRVQVTPIEFDLLALFARNEGRLLTHRMILDEVWGSKRGDVSHYLHVYVSRLRRKIEQDPLRPRHLLTEPGAGYRLIAG
jgi:two-component system KDP operon response regulator KdpE